MLPTRTWRKILPLIFITAFFARAQAQEKEPCSVGVYVTQDDYVHNRLSYKMMDRENGNRVSFTFPADMTLTLKMITSDAIYKFPPGSIYGYNECGNVFRFYPGGKELNAQEDYYKVEEAGSMILYSSVFVSGDETFYSKDLTSPIHRLTLQNLKDDFKDNPEFLAQAKKLKKRPDGLSTRDDHGFEILKVYEASNRRKKDQG